MRFMMLIIFIISEIIFSQNINSKKLAGRVIDKNTGEPLAGANIIIKNSNIGTSSDINGNFVINKIPFSEFQLIISMMGYETYNFYFNEEITNTENIVIELKPTLLEIGTVVVTGTNTKQLYENSPVRIEIIPKKLISQQNACNLAQALGLQTGLIVENDCNNCNFTQVRILGFDGKYSQLLIDGDPVISSLGAVYGLEHYPQEMIEQIEIVKGGGSSLYGGGAIAGTINMITRRPSFNEIKIYYRGNSIDGSIDNQLGAIAEVVSDNNKSGFYVFGSTRYRNSYDRNGDGYSELGKLKNETIGFNGYLKPLENSELQLSFHHIVEDRRGGGDFDKPVHEASIAEWTNHSKWGGKFKWNQKINSFFDYKINYAFSLLKRDSYYGGLIEDTPEARLQELKYYGY